MLGLVSWPFRTQRITDVVIKELEICPVFERASWLLIRTQIRCYIGFVLHVVDVASGQALTLSFVLYLTSSPPHR